MLNLSLGGRKGDLNDYISLKNSTNMTELCFNSHFIVSFAVVEWSTLHSEVLVVISDAKVRN
jgi:hypothetical protein